MTQRGVILAGDVAAMGIGVAAQKLLAQRKDEPIARAWGRTFSWRLAVGGMAGAIIVTGDMLFEGVGGDQRSWTRNAPIALPLGAGLAAWQYHRLRTRMVEEGVTHDAEGEALDDSQGIAVGKAVGIGAGVSAALYVAARGEKLFAGGVGSALTSMNPRPGADRAPGRACGGVRAARLRRVQGPAARVRIPRRPPATRWRPRTRWPPPRSSSAPVRAARCRWTRSAARVAGSSTWR